MKTLIVEDDLITRRLLQKIMEEWGHEVITAENGRDAWNMYQKHEFKIIIADWMMPLMDGVELCRKIRSMHNPGYVYIILLTGKDRKKDLIEGLEAGADDYVIKPIDREELKVRTRAGERILELEKELMNKNADMLALNMRLSDLAMMDPLLEIGNRRSFYNAIEKIHYNASRYLQKYGIIMCDIDHFKPYNDTYGHLRGDQILKNVAGAISHTLRLSDELFRFGGEEFIVILPDQSLEGTTVVAEAMRKKVESLRIEHKGSATGILTISCGISAHEEKDRGRRWEDIINCADKALYVAKSEGRNRVGMPVIIA